MSTISILLMIIFLSQTSQAIDEVDSQTNNGLPPSAAVQGLGSLQSSNSLPSSSLSYSNEIPINDPYLMARHNNYIKRSWQSLQGSWGKRANEYNNNIGMAIDDYPASNRNYHDRYNVDEGNFDGSIMGVGGGYGNGLIGSSTGGEHEYDGAGALLNDDYDFSTMGKRAWKSMNAAWGKRVNGNSNWNNFRG